MKLGIALAGLLALLTPSLALAAGCSHGKQSMTCADGMKLDSESGTCVPDTTA